MKNEYKVTFHCKGFAGFTKDVSFYRWEETLGEAVIDAEKGFQVCYGFWPDMIPTSTKKVGPNVIDYSTDDSFPKFINHQCRLCGEKFTVYVDMRKWKSWMEGTLIQYVWPELSPESRDVIKLGFHLECQAKLYSEME